MMRWLWRMLAVALSLLVASGPAAAGRTVLKVGYVPGTGFLEEDRPGHYLGYGYEYMEFLARYGDWSFEYVPSVSWAECGEKLQSGAIDVLPGMPGSYKSLPNVVRTEHVIGRMPMELVIKGSAPPAHMKLGNIPANPPLPSLPKVAKTEGFTYEIVSYPLFYDMEDAFGRGEIDGYIAPMLDPKKQQNVLAIFDRQSYRLLVRPDRKELLAQLNEAMDQMLLDQPGIRDRLNNKYLRNGGSPLILNRKEREYLSEKKVLNTVIISQQKPYAYKESGEIKGVIPAIIRQMAADLGIEINILETETPAEAKQLVKEGKADFAADAACDFSWAANFNMAPTQSYMYMDYVPVMRRGHTPGDDDVVAVDNSLLYSQTFVMPLYPEERRTYCSSIEDCFRAVSDGKADLVYAPRSEVPYLMEETSSYNLEVASESDFSESISLGVYKGADSRLWQILNKEINHLDASKIHSALNATMSATNHLSLEWLMYHYPMRALGIFAAIALCIILFFWYRMRLRRRHMAIVQHIAYTDARYDLPNLSWLEEETPPLFTKLLTEAPENNAYVVVFAMERKAAVALPYGRELLDKQLKVMAEHLGKMDWALAVAAGSDAGQLVCLAKSKNEADVSSLAHAAVAKYGYIETSEARIWLHMRAGICLLKEPEDLRQAIEQALTAIGEAQAVGSDVRVFDQALQEELELSQRIESYMEKALANKEFKAWYQPKYDIRTHELVGAEALVRWQSPELGFLPPGKFIPLFERNGFVIPVDYFLLEETYQLQKRLLAAGKKPVPISVNQSRLHMTEEGYLTRMRSISDKYNLPADLVELELTETVFGDFDQREQQEHATGIVHSLHELGFKISVDDFGSGYSSFMLLNYLPLDVMKIDRSLLNVSDDSQRMRDILGNIIRLGHTLGMKVICEGIETAEQEKLLLELGCYYGQGYFFAKPMPEEDFLAFWDKKE